MSTILPGKFALVKRGNHEITVHDIREKSCYASQFQGSHTFLPTVLHPKRKASALTLLELAGQSRQIGTGNWLITLDKEVKVWHDYFNQLLRAQGEESKN